MTALDFHGVKKRFGTIVAVDAVDLAVPSGSFFTLLGPSGCGKTSLLRMAAGFVEPDAGRIGVGGVDVTAVQPHRRGLGFVFQSYALFPTKTVAQNIGFALALRGDGRTAAAGRVDEMCRLVGLAGLEARFPHELSGGQQQRVALARALAPSPPILLLDEPLSALDAEIRTRLREEIRRIVEQVGITALYVTHDQEEALAISDVVAVMRDGRVLQVGPPSAIYLRPRHAFVARFIGTANVMRCHAPGQGLAVCGDHRVAARSDGPAIAAGTATVLTWRPEHGRVGSPGMVPGGLPVRLLAASFLGPVVRLKLSLPTGETVAADLAARDWFADPREPGAELALGIDPEFATVLAADPVDGHA